MNEGSDSLALKSIVDILRANWLTLLLVVAASFLGSSFFAISRPDVYSARALVVPSERGTAGLSGLASQYGGLATLAGLTLPGAGSSEASKAEIAVHLLKSLSFMTDFVERRELLPQLMAAKSWDPDTGRVLYDTDLYDAVSGQWVRKAAPPRLVEPSMQEAHEKYLKRLQVIQDSRTGFVTIIFKHESPEVAANWVEWLIEDINEAMKNQDIMEATRSIEFLSLQAESTALAELQVMFYELIQSQTETMMLAEARPEYIFRTIDPAVIPETANEPNRLVMVLGGTIAGSIFAFVIILARHFPKLR